MFWVLGVEASLLHTRLLRSHRDPFSHAQGRLFDYAAKGRPLRVTCLKCFFPQTLQRRKLPRDGGAPRE